MALYAFSRSLPFLIVQAKCLSSAYTVAVSVTVSCVGSFICLSTQPLYRAHKMGARPQPCRSPRCRLIRVS